MKLIVNEARGKQAPYENEVINYFTHPKFTRTAEGVNWWEVWAGNNTRRPVFLTALFCAMVESSVKQVCQLDSLQQGEEMSPAVYFQYKLAWYDFVDIAQLNQFGLAEILGTINWAWKYAEVFVPYRDRLMEDEVDDTSLAHAATEARLG